jgi:hypothetical protein
LTDITVLFHELAASVTTPLNSIRGGAAFAIDVELGSDTFQLIFDTGSSDLWVAEQDVECVNANGKKIPTKRCAFGPLWSGDYEDGQVPRQNFNISYGGGEFLVGTLGYEDVTVAGITVQHQEIASVDEAFWDGDGESSGIMGFAYSSLTSAYTGTNPANDDPRTNNVHYKNWLANAIDEGKIDSLFSVAIERGANGGGGQVALGGLPTIPFTKNFASTPIEIHSFTPRHPIEAKKRTYYTINPDGVVVDGQSTPIDFATIVDTGTTLVYFPADLTQAINEAFDPPSVFEQSSGLWENYCDAVAPDVSFTIGGKNFKISAAELLLQGELGEDPQTGGCVSIPMTFPERTHRANLVG